MGTENNWTPEQQKEHRRLWVEALRSDRCFHCGAEIEANRASSWELRFCNRTCRDYPTAKQKLASGSVRADNGCLIWCRGGDKDGYGLVRLRGAMHRTHRLSYETFVGAIGDGLSVMHSCDNPRCIEPSHLSIGTNAENTADRQAKGRGARLERAGAKLSLSQVAAVRGSNLSAPRLALEYGVCASTIYNIRHERTYSEPPGLLAPLSTPIAEER